MKHSIDEQLIAKARRGDSAAFSEIYFALRDPVFGFAYRMLGEPGAAEDIAHDVFIFFIENPQKYQPARGTLLSFLCGVTRNLVMHRLRQSKTRLEMPRDEDEDFTELPDAAALNPLKVLLEEELAKRVAEEVGKLSPLLREVILLREMQEFSYGEIAEITGADIGAVKVRLHRARKILAAQLAPYYSEGKKDKSYELCRS